MKPAIFFTTEPRFCSCRVSDRGRYDHTGLCPARCRAQRRESIGRSIFGPAFYSAQCRLEFEHDGPHEGDGMDGNPVLWHGPES